MRDLLADYTRLAETGPVGRAVVTAVWGSAPRPEGSSLIATPDARMAGSVSGGCVENAAVLEIVAAIARGTPSTVSWGVSHERAWELGLSCGGTIGVLVEPSIRPEVLAAARSDGGSVVATVTGGGAPAGSGLVLDEHGGRKRFGEFPAGLEEAVAAASRNALERLGSRVETIGEGEGAAEVFLEVYPRRPTLLVFGGVHIATHLARMAKPLGFRTVVADGREAFLSRERFPDADELILGWPEEVFGRTGIDAATCVVLLTHDPKFDEPALDIALRSSACYVGAIGSRKTQQLRRERLRSAGFTPEEIARLHGPIGLDLGGREPAEIALAILAEINAVRHRRPVPARS
ncbi:MAG: XdhC family protein [Gemmatimonadales bacterium]